MQHGAYLAEFLRAKDYLIQNTSTVHRCAIRIESMTCVYDAHENDCRFIPNHGDITILFHYSGVPHAAGAAGRFLDCNGRAAIVAGDSAPSRLALERTSRTY